jgi:photosystem II stability/assembly factor-like uncharacterized protein
VTGPDRECNDVFTAALTPAGPRFAGPGRGYFCNVATRISLLVGLLIVAGLSVAFAKAGGPGLAWQLTPTGSDARLRGLSAVSDQIAWASGSGGTVLRTVDGGQSWQRVSPPGTNALQFRDIEAFGADDAVILSIGVGGDSRVYVTSDAGRNWALAFTNDDPNAFYDCMTFFDQRHGLALSDPVDGRFRIIATSDGGASWKVVDADMPPALAGEFAFAASGQCLVSLGHRAWFATGGAAEARVFRSDDGGRSWTAGSTPIRSGPTAGIFALAFHDARHGLAVGGDFTLPALAPDALALSPDGGTSWKLVDDAPNEYRSGAAWANGQLALVVGPTGSDASFDGGLSWTGFDDGSFDTVDCAHGGACWASGEQGRVARLVRSR